MNESSQQSQYMSPVGSTVEDDDEIDFRELFDVVWSGKWLVVTIALVTLLASTIYALTATPVYQAQGLVQVEQEGKSSIGKSMDQLSLLTGASPTEAPAEIVILKSELVLGEVVEKLRLEISAEPHYLPVLGRAYVRVNKVKSPKLAAPLFGLDSYAWGGESIRVTALDLPEDLIGKPLTLVAGPEKFSLLDHNEALLLSGVTGERVTSDTPYGSVSIFVQALSARPGTRFDLVRKDIQVALAGVSSSLSAAEQPKDSGMISLTYASDDARFAAEALNAVQVAYLHQNVDRRSSQAQQSLEFLKQQLPELRANVDTAQAKLNDYQVKKGTVDVKQETEILLKRAVELETQRQQLLQQRDVALLRYTPQHPIVTAFEQQVRGLEREANGIKGQVETLPKTQREVLDLMRDVEVNTELYTALLNSSQELQVTKAGTTGNVRIIDKARPPLKPVKPKKSLIMAMGLAVGLFLGVMTVFAMRAMLRGVDRPEEVERVLGLPTYASIPYSQAQNQMARKVRAKDYDGGILASLDGTDLAVEAIRSLRTSLHFAMMEAENNVVMFTGPVAALGKSFVTINLGAVIAMSGKRAIVVDADMRRGILYRYVKVPQRPGLSDYVVGTAQLSDVVRPTTVQGLDFLPGGMRPPNPAEILMSERFTDLLTTLSKSYDYVLIDTPPTLPVTDAAIVGRHAGTTLVVVKAAEHPMRAIEETVKRLRQGGTQVRGVIFNQVGARVGSYGYGSYGYSYGYSNYGYRGDAKRSD